MLRAGPLGAQCVACQGEFGAAQQWMMPFWGDNKRVTVPIQFPVGVDVEVDCAVWRREQDGCHVWWSAPQLFEMLNLRMRSTAAHWIANRKGGWTNFLGEMSLMFFHLRCSSPCANQAAILDFMAVANRPLHFTSLSSVALVVLLWGLGSNHSAYCAFQDEDNQTMSLMLLDGLAACLPEVRIRVNIDPTAERVGRYVAGHRARYITMKGGTFNREDLFGILRETRDAFGSPLQFDNTAIWDDRKDELTFADLSRMFNDDGHGIGNESILKQILRGFGSALDAQVASSNGVDVKLDDDADFAPNMFGAGGAEVEPEGVASSRMLLRYMQGSKRHYGDPDRISIIMGASRQDHRKMMHGVVVDSKDVMEDYFSEVGTGDGGAPTEEEKERYRKRRRTAALALLNINADEGAEGVAIDPKRKMFRQTSYCALKAFNNMRLHVSGKGVSAVKVSKSDFENYTGCVQWRSDRICSDQGSDMMVIRQYLRSSTALCNVDADDDISHAINNDFDLANKETKQWGMTRLLRIARNAVHGPWDERRRFHQPKDVLREIRAYVDPATCPIWLEAVPSILSEMGKDERMSEDQIESTLFHEVFNDIDGYLVTSGVKDAPARWRSDHCHSRIEQQWWSVRKVLWFYYSTVVAEDGGKGFAKRMKELQAMAPKHGDGSGDKQTMKVTSKEIDRFRMAATGTCQLAAVVYSNDNYT
ncbi:unnamed protein product [Prorocentrum cordatum]|uniref:Uncharacterized protein n=1 Tax=Prorocentrum cordatum TaxID=2364126 RepID=A0ABN9VN31_9DINO|nr:unnamed protein product [Polarella glacialis]